MNGQTKENLSDVGEFISEYTAHLMGCGVHTSRVVRNAKRIGDSFGYNVHMTVLQKNVILTLVDEETHEHYSEVSDIRELPISFEHNSLLSALSWETFDKHLPLNELRQKYAQVLARPTMSSHYVWLLASLANASFCKLFGGDALSMGIVFVATLLGMFLKHKMTRAGINHYIVFVLSAFAASMCASTALACQTTSEIALATSVLYLVPGVPLINGVIDTIEGYVLNGFARLVRAALLIICIAIGLSFTLLLFKDNLLLS